MSRTADQTTNVVGFPKAGELIEIRGAHELEASDRAILNILYQHAHDSGRIAEPGAEWGIAIGDLRPSKAHKGNERIKDSLVRLMRVVVEIPAPDPTTGKEIVLSNLFTFFRLPADESRPGGIVRFGFAKDVQPVLARSVRWGRIKAEIVCAMRSKYAIALYEMIQLRAGLERCTEEIGLERFRELMGVPPGKLTRGNDFDRTCIRPALLEVNGLSDRTVEIEVKREHAKGPIQSVVLAWWEKQGDAYRETLRERQRPKLGRMARLKGLVDTTIDEPLTYQGSTTTTYEVAPLTERDLHNLSREDSDGEG